MNTRRKSKLAALTQAIEAAQGGDSIQPKARVEVTSSTIPLDGIAERTGGDTRPLNPTHVEELTKSIALLGLIEPLVVDNQNRLLAGGHRKAAISLLKEKDPESFQKHFSDGIPVHQLSFDAELQPDLAVQIEIAENEQRRDYTPAEVRAIADRFREAGYGVRGRPGKDDQPLIPALMSVIGKSRRTVYRYLEEEGEKSVPDGTLSKPDYDRMLRQAHRTLERWVQKPRKSKAEKTLEKELSRAVKALETFLRDS